MSIRQTLQVYHPVDVAQYLDVLLNNYGAMENPYQPNSFLIDNPPLPFYLPQRIEDRLAIVSFSYLPLSAKLVRALHEHTELAPPHTKIAWLEEQDVMVTGTVESLGRRWFGKER